MANLLIYVGSIVSIAWGLAHIFPTRKVVEGFGAISADNRLLIKMEWVAEGLALIFIGLLTGLVTWQAGPADHVAALVLRACGGMLLVMAVWTALSGGRTAIIPIKICPLVKTIAAACFILPTIL